MRKLRIEEGPNGSWNYYPDDTHKVKVEAMTAEDFPTGNFLINITCRYYRLTDQGWEENQGARSSTAFSIVEHPKPEGAAAFLTSFTEDQAGKLAMPLMVALQTLITKILPDGVENL